MSVEEVSKMTAAELHGWLQLEAPAAKQPPKRLEDFFAAVKTRTRRRR